MVKNLKELRSKKGISQQGLAEAIGISQQSVNKYENHKIEPDIATLIKIADYFDVTLDYLVGRTDENGKNVQLSDSERIKEKYLRLSDSEKLCIDVIVDTFYNKNAKK